MLSQEKAIQEENNMLAKKIKEKDKIGKVQGEWAPAKSSSYFNTFPLTTTSMPNIAIFFLCNKINKINDQTRNRNF
ncbi:hypothetical protein HAX54_020634 [Datura stramonium]|uniref:Uncharacterized protein n=1 Tax=Datura stramonium TaxID=4076 RepID=A0ABS8S2R2_DATST|nr:hypothetical protein [Datura stramonium]